MTATESIRKPTDAEWFEAAPKRKVEIAKIDTQLRGRKDDPAFAERETLVNQRRALQEGYVTLNSGDVVRLTKGQRRWNMNRR